MENNTKSIPSIIIIVLLSIVGASMIAACGADETHDAQNSRNAGADSSGQDSAASAPTPQAATEWYAGGTLGDKTVSEWRGATDANRLATSAGIVMLVGGYASMPPDLKQRAAAMSACISETVLDGAVDNDKVSEIAATCAVLLGYEPMDDK